MATAFLGILWENIPYIAWLTSIRMIHKKIEAFIF